jgi:hypothetical protein
MGRWHPLSQPARGAMDQEEDKLQPGQGAGGAVRLRGRCCCRLIRPLPRPPLPAASLTLHLPRDLGSAEDMGVVFDKETGALGFG